MQDESTTFQPNSLPEFMRARHSDMSSEQQAAYHRYRREAIKAGTWKFRPWSTRTEADRKARRRESMRKANAARYERGRALLIAAKSRPCVDCGIKLPPECMDLDHVRGEKAFSLARWNRERVPPGTTRMKMLAAEIAKCDVRCPNCHRMRHFYKRTGDLD